MAENQKIKNLAVGTEKVHQEDGHRVFVHDDYQDSVEGEL